MLAVDADIERRARLRADLAHRFDRDYEVLAADSGTAAALALDRIAEAGQDLAIVFAPAADGELTTELFAAVRGHYPHAGRVLIQLYEKLGTNELLNEAMALGRAEAWVTAPWDPPDASLYPLVSELLAEWIRRTRSTRVEAIKVVAEHWGPRSHRLRDYLERSGVPFGFYDRDSEPGHAILKQAGVPDATKPVLVLFDGRVLRDPSEQEIAAAFGIRTTPAPGRYDLAVVGAGPAGMSATVAAASEGLRTLQLEGDALGGQAGTTSSIRNYLGFPRGISGRQLTLAGAQQSAFFGAVFALAGAESLRYDGDDLVLGLPGGEHAIARAVIVATGASYTRLGVEDVEALVGRGVFYGATVTEAMAMKGRDVYVVGAGNSAGQAAVHLAHYARSVTMLVRRDGLQETMSDYLIRTLAELANVEVRFSTEVVGCEGDGALRGLELARRDAGEVERVRADALFVLIGASPHTEWLPDAVARDPGGYLLTGADIAPPEGAGAAPSRLPMLAETSMRGVFAAGDARHGSIKRVAAAAGEGATAVRVVHDYLAALG
jgi:thioredoxin reductase (NADPH)